MRCKRKVQQGVISIQTFPSKLHAINFPKPLVAMVTTVSTLVSNDNLWSCLCNI